MGQSTHFFIVRVLQLKSLSERLKDLVLPILESEGVHLIDVQLKGRSGNQTLKVFIDTEDGVTLDKCTEVSKRISERLDIEDLIAGKYRLEVSSPGVNRPLQNSQDFKRNLNREVEILFEENAEAQNFRGEIIRVSEDTITIEGKSETKTISIARIKHGKLSLPW